MPIMLSQLLAALPEKYVSWEGEDLPVHGIAYDSRKVKPGHLFVAVPGMSVDGHQFIGKALEAGAMGVVCRSPAIPSPERSVPWVMVPDTRRALSLLTAEFFGHPARRLNLLGVTGTNGKTTVAHLLDVVFRARLGPTGIIGTIGYQVKDERRSPTHTTPESLELQTLLADMVRAGVRTVAMEVSSHGLALGRVHGVPFDVAVFTNLTQDHLDFHGTLEAYWDAKGSLFRSLPEARRQGKEPVAILNVDDPRGRLLTGELDVPVVTYGTVPDADLAASGIEIHPTSTTFTVRWKGGEPLSIAMRLLGRFNVSNALAAMAAGLARGIPLQEIARAIQEAPAVPGRFERVESGEPFTVIVDYAHTPDGLTNLLQSARELAAGRVITVFGCGGDRDRGKRPRMGYEAARFSDILIVTSDNPRSEEPLAIINEIRPGIESAPLRGKTRQVFEEPDREKAIALALARAEPRDMVVIAGKGHETYQIFRDRTIHFDDREVVRKILGGKNVRHLTMGDVAAITGGSLLFGEPASPVAGVSTDTRTLSPGSLYVPLKGERFDGHEFLANAEKKRAGGVLVGEGWKGMVPSGVPRIRVADPLRAYMALARSHRMRFRIPVVAVTGSNGKTTTKELTAALLRSRFAVLSARESYNNEVGVPKTLLAIGAEHQAVVLELAMRGRGEIRELAETALPTAGVITNIGEAHLERLGSREAIMHAKGELLEALPTDGLAVLPARDPWVGNLAAKCRCRIVYYWIATGEGDPAYTVRPIRRRPDGEEVLVMSPAGNRECRVPLLGEHNLRNVAAALALALELGVTLDAAVGAIERFAGVSRRLVPRRCREGGVVLDDTYNASPASMREALAVLAGFPGARRRFAVLADMLELGETSAALHREVGAATAGLDYLVTCGELAAEIAEGARLAGMADNNIKQTRSVKEAVSALPRLAEGDVVLVKGSRKMRMERVVDLLLGEEGE